MKLKSLAGYVAVLIGSAVGVYAFGTNQDCNPYTYINSFCSSETNPRCTKHVLGQEVCLARENATCSAPAQGATQVKKFYEALCEYGGTVCPGEYSASWNYVGQSLVSANCF
jgi:hypothetical protein